MRGIRSEFKKLRSDEVKKYYINIIFFYISDRGGNIWHRTCVALFARGHPLAILAGWSYRGGLSCGVVPLALPPPLLKYRGGDGWWYPWVEKGGLT